ncbi:CsbD family protein [Tropicimonas sp. IMCC34043]|uniref:CsbD family protein n=1 Tax=Tropicimonas sp. IMCC34043 TaxID=2248760 RepID=UPI000E2767B1|nr:CsbD family protein [Tropicimonas sp. IMCC34043]
MDKDRIIGSAKIAKGKAKVAIAKVIGNEKLESEGEADKIAGRIQNTAGGVKDTIRDA